MPFQKCSDQWNNSTENVLFWGNIHVFQESKSKETIAHWTSLSSISKDLANSIETFTTCKVSSQTLKELNLKNLWKPVKLVPLNNIKTVLLESLLRTSGMDLFVTLIFLLSWHHSQLDQMALEHWRQVSGVRNDTRKTQVGKNPCPGSLRTILFVDFQFCAYKSFL